MSHKREGQRWQHTLRLTEAQQELHDYLMELAKQGKANQWIIRACQQLKGQEEDDAFREALQRARPETDRIVQANWQKSVLESERRLNQAGRTARELLTMLHEQAPASDDEPTYEPVEGE